MFTGSTFSLASLFGVVTLAGLACGVARMAALAIAELPPIDSTVYPALACLAFVFVASVAGVLLSNS